MLGKLDYVKEEGDTKMNKSEYEKIQLELSALMDQNLMKSKSFNAKEREVYILAVKACKSVLSNYNPKK